MRTLQALIGGMAILTTSLAAGQSAAPAPLTDRERAFVERLRGATLVGRFTLDGRDDREAAPDRYDIANVEKVDDTRWRFSVRIQYGGKDITMPVVLPLMWIDDTPAIHVNNFTIPLLGTYTVHLVFYEDRYAGIWKAAKLGGHMFGRIESKPAQ